MKRPQRFITDGVFVYMFYPLCETQALCLCLKTVTAAENSIGLLQ